MSKIPILKAGRRVGPQGPSTPVNRREGQKASIRATEQMVKTFTGNAANIAEMRQKSQANKYNMEASLAFKSEISAKERELRIKHQGDTTGYSDAMREQLQVSYDRYADEAPTQFARDFFVSNNRGYVDRTALNSDNWENTQRSKNILRTYDNLKRQMESKYSSAGSPTEANEEFLEIKKGVDNSRTIDLGDVQADVVTEETRKGIRTGVLTKMTMDNFSMAGTTSLEQADEFADKLFEGSVSGTEEVFRNMDADEKRVWKQRLLNSFKANQRVNQKEVKAIARSTVALNTSGDTSAYETVKNRVIRELPDGVEKQRLLMSLEVSKGVGEVVKDFPSMPNDELQSTVNDFIQGMKPQPGVAADIQLRAQSQIKSAFEAEMRERRSDPYLYAISHNNKMANNFAGLEAYYDDLGMEPAYMTRNQARQTAKEISNMNIEAQADSIDGIIQRYGSKYAPYVLRQLSKEDSNFKSYFTSAAYFDDNKTKELVLETWKNKSAIKQDYTAAGGNIQLVRGETSRLMQDFRQAYFDVGDNEFSNDMSETVTLRAMNLITNQNASPRDAVSQAFDETVGSNWSIYKGDSGSIVYPANLQSKKVVDDYLYNSISEEGLASLGVDPLRAGLRGFAEKDLMGEIKERAFWGPSKEQDRATLYMRQGDGSQPRMLEDKDGNPISVKFTDMSMELDNLSKLKDYEEVKREEVRTRAMNVFNVFGGF